VTGLLCTQQFQDWSAEYRLYREPRLDLSKIWGVLRRGLEAAYERDPQRKDSPFLVAMEDSLVRKTGTRIHGVAWRRDPLSPPFQTHLVRGQRVLQLSAAYPPESPDALNRPNFSGFTTKEDSTMKPEKFHPHLASTLFYAFA
jgi:hypothetical protein